MAVTWCGFATYDETAVKQYSMPLFKGLSPEKKQYADYPGFYTYKYPIAGEQNSTCTVWSYDIASQCGATT